MFRKELERKLKLIFGLPKVSFNAPGESFEQDTMFVGIDNARTQPREGKCLCKAEGTLVVYSEQDKMPYGFFNKKIEQADKTLTKDFFFYDIDANIENSPARFVNVTERRVSFVFLYSEQYDPNLGQLTSLELEYEE